MNVKEKKVSFSSSTSDSFIALDANSTHNDRKLLSHAQATKYNLQKLPSFPSALLHLRRQSPDSGCDHP